MPYEVLVDLPKLGRREYLHGTSIFNAMLDVCGQHLGEQWAEGALISSFKLIRESLTNGKFVVSRSAVDGLDATATFNVRIESGDVFAYFVPEGRAAEREPYEEDRYYRTAELGADFEGSFVLDARPRADFIRGVVGANKLLHQKAKCFASEPSRIRFLYLKDLDGMCLPANCPTYGLAFSNVMIQDRGAEVWTINRATLTSATGNSEFRICYAASKP